MHHRPARRRAGTALAALVLAAGVTALGPPAPAGAAAPGTTELVSVSSTNVQGTAGSQEARTNADGRYVVFNTFAALAAADTNETRDAYLRDRQSGTTVLASLTHADVASTVDSISDAPDVSDDGRYIVFSGPGVDMVAGTDQNGFQADVFLRDRVAGTTERISNKSDGTQPFPGAVGSYEPRISGNGRYVAFTSAAALVPADNDGYYDVYRVDLVTDTVVLVSVNAAGGQIPLTAWRPDISLDGNIVTFDAEGQGIAGGDTSSPDVFARNIIAGTTTLVSKTTAGAAVAATAGSSDSAVSADGRYVVFESAAALTAADTNATTDVYRHDLNNGQTVRVSVTDTEAQVAESSQDADVTADGNQVTFTSDGVLRSGDTNGLYDIYVRNITASTSTRISLSTAGVQNVAPSYAADVSDDGGVATFETPGKLAANDTFIAGDVYAHTLGLVTTCEPPGPFPDVAYTHPFCDDIKWLVDEGITSGYSDGTFRPSAGLTRQAMAAFIYRFSGSPPFADPAVASFSDVPTNHQFFTEIEWMKANGLSNGYADGTFRPTAPITRQAMAAFLYRLAGSPPFDDPFTATFVDMPTSNVFFTEVEWMAVTGLIDGFSDATFRPVSPVNRERMAAFLHAFADAGLLV